MQQPKTNAIRILEGLGIRHRTMAYEVDEEDLSAESVARKLGLEPERVFKTLALLGDRTGVFLACVPAGSELDLKKAAKASGNKAVELLPLKELLPTTGYVRGGCSPIGTKRKFPVFVDETAQLHEEISVSAGLRGLQVLLSPQDLLAAAMGQPGPQVPVLFADIT
jgi:Cys-tRNA(Pro)/Cys-tRNA(Cys) deacylase